MRALLTVACHGRGLLALGEVDFADKPGYAGEN
jgi:hypothetical protein